MVVTADHVLGHGETKVTNCPGKNLHIDEIRNAHKNIFTTLNTSKELTNDTAKLLDGAIAEFKRRFMASK